MEISWAWLKISDPPQGLNQPFNVKYSWYSIMMAWNKNYLSSFTSLKKKKKVKQKDSTGSNLGLDVFSYYP